MMFKRHIGHTHTLSLSQDSFLILLGRQMRANLALVKG